MQTYGYGIGIIGPKSVSWVFYWPLTGPDKKTPVPSSILPYSDDMQREGAVFCRIRTVAKEQLSSSTGNIVCTQGGYFLKEANLLMRVWKDCDFWITSSVRYSSSRYRFGIEIQEHKPKVQGGTVVLTKRSASIAIYVSRSDFSETGLLALISANYSRVLSSLLAKPFSGPIVVGFTGPCDPGTPVYGDSSVYAGIARTHFQSLVTLGTPCDQRSLSAAQMAYVNAMDKLPNVEANGLANTIELAAFLSSLLRKDFAHATKGISDAWLAYRYSYTTTLLDVRDYSKYVNRLRSLNRSDSPVIRTHGYFSDSGWSFHVSVKLNVGSCLPKSVSEALDQFGFGLDAVNAWDMLPYSFVVDWFLPISDLLDAWASQWKSRDITVTEAWLSITSPNGDCYVRAPWSWHQAPPLLRCDQASGKTIFMRIADAIALLVR